MTTCMVGCSTITVSFAAGGTQPTTRAQSSSSLSTELLSWACVLPLTRVANDPLQTRIHRLALIGTVTSPSLLDNFAGSERDTDCIEVCRELGCDCHSAPARLGVVLR
jgi:hypothetical protein